MKRLGWRNIVFFGCKNQIMVAVTKRFESGPIKTRVGAFPDVFGVLVLRTSRTRIDSKD